NNPAGGGTIQIPNLAVPADTLIVFVGGGSLGGGEAGYASSSFSYWGDQAWNDLVRGRGQAGALLPAGSQTDVGPWGGSISFDASKNWYFGVASAVPAGQLDFYSVAQHELGHLLGISVDFTAAGTPGTNSWTNRIVNHMFTGPAAEALFGGPVPTDA